MAAQAAEGVRPRVPLRAQPHSITEWSIDLHYGFPSSFPEREEALRVCGPSLGVPRSVRTAPGAWLPWESPRIPFLQSPLSPPAWALRPCACLRSFLLQPAPTRLPSLGQVAPPGFFCRAPPSPPLTPGNGALLALPLAPSWTAAPSAMGHFWASDLGQREVSAPFPWP